jgi:hypothetical protein
MRILLTFLLGLLLAPMPACAQAQPHPDACQALIPRTLADALARAYPDYRTPLETDNAPEDVRHRMERGGDSCLGVAIADFTGDGKKDYLLGLAARKGSAGLAVIALPIRGGWRYQKLHSGVESARVQLVVQAAEPGRHERPAAIGGPLEAGERRSIDCRHWAAKVGAVDSTGRVYCFQDGGWSFVRSSD